MLTQNTFCAFFSRQVQWVWTLELGHVQKFSKTPIFWVQGTPKWTFPMKTKSVFFRSTCETVKKRTNRRTWYTSVRVVLYGDTWKGFSEKERPPSTIHLVSGCSMRPPDWRMTTPLPYIHCGPSPRNRTLPGVYYLLPIIFDLVSYAGSPLNTCGITVIKTVYEYVTSAATLSRFCPVSRGLV